MVRGRRAVLGGFALGVAWLPFARASSDSTGGLIATLRTAKSFKVRIHAAVLLATQPDSRGFTALGQAASSDPEPAARAVILRLLAKNPGGDAAGVAARRYIEKGLADRTAKVRAAARGALVLLSKNLKAAKKVAGTTGTPAGGRITIAVGRMAGRVPAPVREYMRREVTVKLRRNGRVSVLDENAPDAHFVLDGTIKQLILNKRQADVEASAAVDLVLSKPPRGILLVASGEAVVQKSQRFMAGDLRTRMMEEAIGHAVGSAHENLEQFLARQ